MRRLGDLIEENGERLAELEVRGNGDAVADILIRVEMQNGKILEYSDFIL